MRYFNTNLSEWEAMKQKKQVKVEKILPWIPANIKINSYIKADTNRTDELWKNKYELGNLSSEIDMDLTNPYKKPPFLEYDKTAMSFPFESKIGKISNINPEKIKSEWSFSQYLKSEYNKKMIAVSWAITAYKNIWTLTTKQLKNIILKTLKDQFKWLLDFSKITEWLNDIYNKKISSWFSKIAMQIAKRFPASKIGLFFLHLNRNILAKIPKKKTVVPKKKSTPKKTLESTEKIKYWKVSIQLKNDTYYVSQVTYHKNKNWKFISKTYGAKLGHHKCTDINKITYPKSVRNNSKLRAVFRSLLSNSYWISCDQFIWKIFNNFSNIKTSDIWNKTKYSSSNVPWINDVLYMENTAKWASGWRYHFAYKIGEKYIYWDKDYWIRITSLKKLKENYSRYPDLYTVKVK